MLYLFCLYYPPIDPCDASTHIVQGYFTDTVPFETFPLTSVVILEQVVKWNNATPQQNTYVRTVCILFGVYAFLYEWVTVIPAWVSNYTHYSVWDELTFPFPNCNGATVEIRE